MDGETPEAVAEAALAVDLGWRCREGVEVAYEGR